MSLHLFKHCSVASCGQREWEGTAVSLGPRVTPQATLPLQEVVWRLVSSADGVSFWATVCWGRRGGGLGPSAQAVNGAETFPGVISN